jgi:hypothetical protein
MRPFCNVGRITDCQQGDIDHDEMNACLGINQKDGTKSTGNGGGGDLNPLVHLRACALLASNPFPDTYLCICFTIRVHGAGEY